MREHTTLQLDREIVDTVGEMGGGTLPEVYRILTGDGTRPHLRGQRVAIRWHRLVDASVLVEEGDLAYVDDRAVDLDAQPQFET